jgi:hypothetical protein
MTDEPTTQELRLEQIQRASEEHERASRAASEPEERAAERRADKAEYLKRKLEEQERR